MASKIKRAITHIAGFYIVLNIAMFTLQSYLLFPGLYLVNKVDTPNWEQYDNTAHIKITTNDEDKEVLSGIKISGQESKKNVVILFGGNAQNSADLAYFLGGEIAKYADIISINYRGFANSTGHSNEKNVLSDSLQIYDNYSKKYDKIFVIGISLGSSVASYVTGKRKVDGLVLVTPFDSARKVAMQTYPFMPINFLMRDSFDTESFLLNNTTPKAVIAASDDNIIPPARLAALMPTLKNVVYEKTIENTNHNSILWDSSFKKILLKSLQKTGL